MPDHEVEKEEEAGFTTLPEQAARKKARVHGLSGIALPQYIHE